MIPGTFGGRSRIATPSPVIVLPKSAQSTLSTGVVPTSAPPTPVLLCACFDETRHILWAASSTNLHHYIPAIDFWIDDGPIAGITAGPQAMWADDGLVVIVSNNLSPAETVRYDLDSATWTTGLAPMPTPAFSTAHTTVGGASNPYLYVCCGQIAGFSLTDDLQRYDPIGDSWTVLAPTTPDNVTNEHLIPVGDYLYQLSAAQLKYRISTDTWSSIGGATDGFFSGIPAVAIDADSIIRARLDGGGGYTPYTISTDTYGGSVLPWPSGAGSGWPAWMLFGDGLVYAMWAGGEFVAFAP